MCNELQDPHIEEGMKEVQKQEEDNDFYRKALTKFVLAYSCYTKLLSVL